MPEYIKREATCQKCVHFYACRNLLNKAFPEVIDEEIDAVQTMAVNSNEVWKDIAGYEGLYQVSNLGRVKRDGRIKTLSVDRGGYLYVWLSKHSKMKCLKVHRLVADAFIENPNGKRTVNHIDGNKKNNQVDNLEWATHSENIIHANKTGLRVVTEAQRKAASINGKKTCDKNRKKKSVYCSKDGIKQEFESAHAGARSVGGSPSPIVQCCKGKKKTYKGYEWGYC